MGAAQDLAEMFAAVAIGNRNPSWAEFEKSSPAEQRAIRRRWFEILTEPLTWDNTAGPRAREREQAEINFHRATFGPSERKHDQYSTQVETGAFIDGKRETVSFGDQTGE